MNIHAIILVRVYNLRIYFQITIILLMEIRETLLTTVSWAGDFTKHVKVNFLLSPSLINNTVDLKKKLKERIKKKKKMKCLMIYFS